MAKKQLPKHKATVSDFRSELNPTWALISVGVVGLFAIIFMFSMNSGFSLRGSQTFAGLASEKPIETYINGPVDEAVEAVDGSESVPVVASETVRKCHLYDVGLDNINCEQFCKTSSYPNCVSAMYVFYPDTAPVEKGCTYVGTESNIAEISCVCC